MAGLDQPAPLPIGDNYFTFAWSKTEPVGGVPTTVAGADAATVSVKDAMMQATLSELATAVGAIPTSPLLSTNSRLNHLDANVSSRAAQEAQMDLVNAPNGGRDRRLQAATLTAIAAIPAPPSASEGAAAILQTDLSTIEDDAPADSLCTVCLATLHSSVAGTTWTIRKTDGATKVAKTVAISADAVPIVGVT